MKNKILTFLLCSCVFIAPAVSAGMAGAATTSNLSEEMKADVKDAKDTVKSEINEVGRSMDKAGTKVTTVIHRPDGTVVSNANAVRNSDGTVRFSDGTMLNADGSVKFADGSYRDASGVFYNADGTRYVAVNNLRLPNGAKVDTSKAVRNADGTITYADGTVQETDGTIRFADGSYRDKNGVYYNADGSKHATVGDSGQSVGEYLDDAGITASVKAKFLGQSGLDSMDLHVETMNGTVTISGQVDNQAQKSLAEEVAHEVDGVSNVVNKISVKK